MIGGHLATVLTPLPVLVPMVAAALTLLAGRKPRLQRGIAVLALPSWCCSSPSAVKLPLRMIT
ncbi:putative monovalent cation/H+ antiporter subunit D [Mycolicibacterium chubuense]|uniref:Putative monovalent cation/H+ antiporter subunit D n=1 Tax=Mycolicibacterium chubuense TaxID=1800 RepID=A0A0J6W7T3_MYCCU|nr:hypothetical protein [Mycolicibacterium chubuense]KMO79305.1 putative monovalent cation/H+ antiporter subunit D [Mycolicibacterium chubuense]